MLLAAGLLGVGPVTESGLVAGLFVWHAVTVLTDNLVEYGAFCDRGDLEPAPSFAAGSAVFPSIRDDSEQCAGDASATCWVTALILLVL